MKGFSYNIPLAHSMFVPDAKIYPPYVPALKHRYTPWRFLDWDSLLGTDYTASGRRSYLATGRPVGSQWSQVREYSFSWEPEKQVSMVWGELDLRKSQLASDTAKFSEIDMEGLPASEFVGVELKVNKETFSQRSRTMATKIGVDSKRLQSRVQGFLYKVPRGMNAQSLRDELEQAIWLQLTHWYSRSGRNITESGQRNALVLAQSGEVAVAYNRWYTRYADERQLSTSAEQRAIALDRAYDRNRQQGLTFAEELQAEAEGTPTGMDSLDEDFEVEGGGGDDEYGRVRVTQANYANLADKDWVDMAEMVETKLSMLKLLEAMPERIRKIAIQKANGYTIIRRDRTYWDKWMVSNKALAYKIFIDNGGELKGAGWSPSARKSQISRYEP